MNATDLDRPITVTEKRVFCDGGVSLGHPGVYLNIEANGQNSGQAVCPYCSRTFVLDPNARPGTGH
jgi:uncharacterized Zn-finger protein